MKNKQKNMGKSIKSILFLFVIFGLVVFAGCSTSKNAGTSDNGKLNGMSTAGLNEGIKVTVFKDPNCGCCGGYVAELKKNGFDVKTVNEMDMVAVKQEYDIPPNMQSCHTAIIGDYFIEGHVPIEAVNKLLEEKPDIDGIVLPGMPSGSPGMPGIKRGSFKVYSLSNGEISEFMTI